MIPNFIFENIIENDPKNKKKYVKNILEAETHRKDREVFKDLRKKGLVAAHPVSHNEHITNYDNQKSWDYNKSIIVEEFKENHTVDKKKIPNHPLTQYIDGIYDFFHNMLNRESYDNRNIPVNVFMNFGVEYNNAFWDGANLAFGNGDGVYFKTFILPDIAAHEFTHAVQDYESGFIYYGQSGALNEHISDVFGIAFDQMYKKQDVTTSKWLIGEGLWTSRVNGVALRSMKDPGTAYNDNVVGSDPQPAHMNDYVNTTDDEGGVHINSGIPNKAFYLANIAVGGKIQYNKIGRIWYDTILKKGGMGSNPDFKTFAKGTLRNAKRMKMESVIIDAWKQVGITL